LGTSAAAHLPSNCGSRLPPSKPPLDVSLARCAPPHIASASPRRLDERIAALRQAWRDVVDAGRVPRLHMIEAECAVHLMEAEREWVERTANEVVSGSLPWPAGREGTR
jgi:hypothetical protein